MLVDGDKLLCRIPKMVAKLDDSWDGPYIVLKKLSAVNYLIGVVGLQVSQLYVIT